MSSKKLLLGLFLFFSIHVSAQNSEEEKLSASIQSFHESLVSANTISLNQQTDKALSYGHSNGWVETKNEMIKNLQTGFIDYKKYSMDSLSLQLNGNMANVRFVADIDAVLNGHDANYKLKVLEVWVKKGNRWLLFARQAVKQIIDN